MTEVTSFGRGVKDPARSIVIPCYNEHDRLPPTLQAVRQYVASSGVATEIVIVDDGSTDGTGDWARAQAEQSGDLRVVSYGGNRGKGFAVKTGMLEALGKVILFMDADSATPVTEADKVWPLLEDGSADIVLGSRRQVGAQVRASQGVLRRAASVVFAMLARVLVLYGVKDTQCGFKGLKRQAAQDVFGQLTSPTAIFDIEMLVLARRAGYRVAEVPVTWSHDEDSRITYNTRRSLMIFAELLRLKWRYRILWPIRVT